MSTTSPAPWPRPLACSSPEACSSGYREMGERLRIRESRDISTSYGGYAVKRAA
jgi:hypothetical protein